MAPGSTLKVMKDGKVEREFRLEVPPRVYNFKEGNTRRHASKSPKDTSTSKDPQGQTNARWDSRLTPWKYSHLGSPAGKSYVHMQPNYFHSL